MGGFEGGDEGGFWDIDELLEPKKDISNKNHKNTHDFKSLIQINNSQYSINANQDEKLHNTIFFVPSDSKKFTIEGFDELPLESNPIYKVYKALLEYTADSDITEFFLSHKVVVKKSDFSLQTIDTWTLLAFSHLLKEACNLVLSDEELVEIIDSVDVS